MRIKVEDLMSKDLVTARPRDTVARLRRLMERNWVHAVPVLGPKREMLGIVSASELIGDVDGRTPAYRIMTDRVYTIRPETDVHLAARIMRTHKLHHLIVTREATVVGVLSAFDMLGLIEQWRFSEAERPRPE